MPLTHPLPRTAFYCCALRADDAARPHPICGDALAARFLDAETRAPLAKLMSFAGPAASNVTRHRIIDDLLRARLATDPTHRVILIGAGFDTRAFRLPGGRWWELDDPELLTFKESRLPAATAPNPLVRLPVSFATESLADRLAPLAGDDPCDIVIEGVSMYLEDAALTDLTRALRRHFPKGRLLMDLQSPAFRRRFSADIANELGRLGAHFATRTVHPAQLIEAQGFRRRAAHSVVGRAAEISSFRIPRWLLATLLRELRDGYAIWEFEAA